MRGAFKIWQCGVGAGGQGGAANEPIWLAADQIWRENPDVGRNWKNHSVYSINVKVASHNGHTDVLSLYTVLWSERSERPAARAAVRAVRSGPLLIAYGTIPYQYR